MQDEDLYVIAELRYRDENPNLTDDDLFPNDWYLSNDYHLKIEIIAKAIINKVLIKDTELYQNKFNENRWKVLTNNKN